MDVSSFMGGNFLTQLDLPAPSQVWSIRDVKQELVGTDQKIVVYFSEHQKGLGLNKTNLRVIAQAYSTNAAAWNGKQLDLFKDQTQFQGSTVPCIRVRVPMQQPPAAAPVIAPQPVAAPWEQNDHQTQQNNPPGE